MTVNYIQPVMRVACSHFYVCLLVAVTYCPSHCSDWIEATNSLRSVEEGEVNAAGEWRIILIVCHIFGV